jgi:hypothetical protein
VVEVFEYDHKLGYCTVQRKTIPIIEVTEETLYSVHCPKQELDKSGSTPPPASTSSVNLSFLQVVLWTKHQSTIEILIFTFVQSNSSSPPPHHKAEVVDKKEPAKSEVENNKPTKKTTEVFNEPAKKSVEVCNEPAKKTSDTYSKKEPTQRTELKSTVMAKKAERKIHPEPPKPVVEPQKTVVVPRKPVEEPQVEPPLQVTVTLPPDSESSGSKVRRTPPPLFSTAFLGKQGSGEAKEGRARTRGRLSSHSALRHGRL